MHRLLSLTPKICDELICQHINLQFPMPPLHMKLDSPFYSKSALTVDKCSYIINDPNLLFSGMSLPRVVLITSLSVLDKHNPSKVLDQ